MHEIEPYYNWRSRYISEEDRNSPFYGRNYDEFQYSTKIYNYFIHPQWDGFGSPTLYTKVLYADYDRHFAIMEFIGEWNDCINNDIMFLKRDLVDCFIRQGIYKFVLIGENVLNLHADGDDYYEEWYEDLIDEGGWTIAINFRDHVAEEWDKAGINRYFHYGPRYNTASWRKFQPSQLVSALEDQLLKVLPMHR